MTIRTRLLVAAAGGMLPMLLYSFSTGPLPRRTGAPGDQTCAACHVGTDLNGGGGGAVLTASSGTTFTSGQQITFTLTVTDPAAKGYGFEATARLDSNPSNGQAGTFTAGEQQRVICESGTERPAGGCPSTGPVEFIEHNHPFATNVINFTWTAPTTDVGPVTIYLATNAANLDGTRQGDHIYTTNLKLTPAAGGGKPTITQGGVVVASNFKAATAAARGGWIEIYGTNLASTTREWAAADFNGNTAPTSLSGVSVTVGGRPAYVSYISPGQVNVLVPGDAPVGSGIQVVVKNGSTESDPVAVTTADVAAAILAPSSLAVGGKQLAAATFPSASTLTYVGTAGSVAGLTMRPAKPGEMITLYGIGFGPVNPAITAGTIAPGTADVTNNVTVQIGGAPATVQYAGCAPQFVGLYQINVTVPNVAAGDSAIVVSVNGTPVAQNMFVTVGQ